MPLPSDILARCDSCDAALLQEVHQPLGARMVLVRIKHCQYCFDDTVQKRIEEISTEALLADPEKVKEIVRNFTIKQFADLLREDS